MLRARQLVKFLKARFKLLKKRLLGQSEKDSVEGWTKLNNVKIEKDSNLSLSSLNTGREGSGNIVSTSGVRGLDGDDITNAQPDMNEFEKLKKLAVQKNQLEKLSHRIAN